MPTVTLAAYDVTQGHLAPKTTTNSSHDERHTHLRRRLGVERINTIAATEASAA